VSLLISSGAVVNQAKTPREKSRLLLRTQRRQEEEEEEEEEGACSWSEAST